MKKSKCKVFWISILLSAACSFTSFAGWQQTDAGDWKFYRKDGSLGTNVWAKSGNNWYYFDNRGNMVFNTLIEDEGKTYHVNADGVMSVNQWVNYNNVYYYAGNDGAIWKSTITPDGYTVDKNGAWDQSIPQQPVSEPITVQIPEAQGYGNVTGNITWQYNKFIGTKADTGADVYLIPLDFNIKGGDNDNLSLCLNTHGKNNVFYAKVDGFGQYVLNNVPSGNYLVFVKSNATTGSLRFNNESEWNEGINNLFENILTYEELETFKTMLGFSKFYIETITITNGQTITISHDFGYTYM